MSFDGQLKAIVVCTGCKVLVVVVLPASVDPAVVVVSIDLRFLQGLLTALLLIVLPACRDSGQPDASLRTQTENINANIYPTQKNS